MTNSKPPRTSESELAFLGIEGGATRTVAVLTDSMGTVLLRKETGPANVRLLSETELIARLSAFSEMNPAALAIGLAGLRSDGDREKIRKAASAIWPGIPCLATNDLETILASSKASPNSVARIVIVSGTGSCCFGRTPRGKTAKIGGWGHLLGDKASGYEIGLRSLKAIVYYYDRDGIWSDLGARILAKLLLNEPDQLIGWTQRASKSEVAALAIPVFEAWKEGDRIATDILEAAAESLASDGVHCAKRLVRSGWVDFTLAGSVLVKQPEFSKLVSRNIRSQWLEAAVHIPDHEGAWGAAQLAKSLVTAPDAASVRRKLPPDKRVSLPPFTHVSNSLTEERNPRSLTLDKLTISAAIALMLSEEAKIPGALRRETPAIKKTIKWAAQSLKRGCRLFYVGAGTSGRLGVLDASECPPTFRSPPGQIQGIIAGGQNALWEAVEGAEDDAEAGVIAIKSRAVTAGDLVIGIAASGRTPFVWGALMAAKKVGARTVLICFDPKLRVSKQFAPGIMIQPGIGPEVLTGSTRLKAGTATKLILNMITTLAMVQTGKVIQNLMVDLNPSNTKLRDRAIRIVVALTDRNSEEARIALEHSGWVIKQALSVLQPKAVKKRGQ